MELYKFSATCVIIMPILTVLNRSVLAAFGLKPNSNFQSTFSIINASLVQSIIVLVIKYCALYLIN